MKNKNNNGFVYSTDPDFNFDNEDESVETLPKEKQVLKIWLERIKGGKEATVIKGFIGSQDDMDILLKTLKTKCGGGGAAKDGEIMVQGNHRDKILDFLLKDGYKNVKKAGG